MSQYPTHFAIGPLMPIFFVLIVLLLAWGIGRGVRRHPKPFAYVLGGLAAVLGVMFLLLLTVRSSRSVTPFVATPYPDYAPAVSHTERPDNAISPPMPEAWVNDQPSTWEPSDRVPFEADLYPSITSAIRAIIFRDLAKNLPQLLPENIPLRKVTLGWSATKHVLTDEEFLSSESTLEEAVRAALIDAGIPGTTVVHQQASQTATPLTADEMRVAVEIQSAGTNSTGSPTTEADDGILQVMMQGANGSKMLRSARYTNAEWCEDFQRWQASQQAGVPGTWILATSDGLCPSQDEAWRQARDRADTQIAAHALQYIGSRPDSARFGLLDLQPHAALNWLRTVADQWVSNGRLSVNRFDQKFTRPYGEVWRSAVLVRVNDPELQALGNLYGSHRTAESQSWVRLVLSTAALLGVILVVYLFLNAATKGYYLWSVRIATVVLAAVGVWCILILA